MVMKDIRDLCMFMFARRDLKDTGDWAVFARIDLKESVIGLRLPELI